MTVTGVWATGLEAASPLLRMTTVGMPPSGPSPLMVNGGVRWTPGEPGKVIAASGLAVTVNPFIAIIPATSSGQGGFGCCNDALFPLTLTAANPSFARRDLVVVRFNTTTWEFEIISVDGDPGDPDPPAVPADALLLADLIVPAGAVTGPELTIVDRREFLAPAAAPSEAVSVTASTAGDVTVDDDAWQSLTTPLSVEFVAPASGRVQITAAARGWASASQRVAFGARIIGPAGYLREPVVGETTEIESSTVAWPSTDSTTFLVTALTAGETYTALFLARNGGGADVGHFLNRRLMAVPAA